MRKEKQTKEKKQSRRQRHKFLNRFTVVGALLLMVWGYFFSEGLVSGLFAAPLRLVGMESEAAVHFGAAIGGLLVLLIHKWWFSPEYEGDLWGGDIRCSLYVGLLFLLIIWIPSIVIEGMRGTLGMPSINAIGISLMAGCCEEAAFRGLPASYLMRQWNKEKQVLATVLFTSAIFGLIHAFNLVAGADPKSTALQVFTSFCTGIIFCAVYLRTGNLLVTIIIHTLHDIVSMTDTSMYVSDGVLAEIPLMDWVINIAQAFVLAIVGFYLIRPAMRKDIVALWAEKWDKMELSNQS